MRTCRWTRVATSQNDFRGSRFVELPGVDHLMWTGDTDALLDEIEGFLTGVRRGPDPDRVLATVLFTDVVGSTEMANRVGDRAWRSLLDRHHQVIRRELERWRGREVDTAGDGFLATFDGPARGVRIAVAATEGVRDLGLEIRAGLHTGEVEIADGNVRGIAVHIGSRVSGLAGPGEVLVSRTVGHTRRGFRHRPGRTRRTRAERGARPVARLRRRVGVRQLGRRRRVGYASRIPDVGRART